MHEVLVAGVGRIGTLIGAMLADSGDYKVQLAERDGRLAEKVVGDYGLPNTQAFELDAGDGEAFAAHVRAWRPHAVIASLPYYLNVRLAGIARAAGVHYFDLTEDLAAAREVRALSAEAETAFVPQCGLAPGFISIAANELMTHFDEVQAVKLRVGALPQFPSNALKYALTWSPEGLINEYANACEGIVDGRLRELRPLEGLEEIEIDGTRYEAFNTSGGLGSLAETHLGRVRRMDYKTMRYPGHCEQMRLLLHGLKLGEDRATLKRILENALPRTLQDVVVIFASVEGLQAGRLCEECYVDKVYPQRVAGRLWSAIQVTTAAGVCSVVDLVLARPAEHRGFVPVERFRLADILANRFGRHFAAGGSGKLSGHLVATGQARRNGITGPGR